MQPLPRLIDAWLSACPRNVCPRAKNQCMVHRLPTLHPDSTSSLPGTCQQPETICRWRVWKPETLVDAMLVLLRCDLQYGVRSWLPLRAPYLSLYHIYLYLIYIIYISLSLSHVYISYIYMYIYIYLSLSLMCLSHIYIYVYIYISYISYISHHLGYPNMLFQPLEFQLAPVTKKALGAPPQSSRWGLSPKTPSTTRERMLC